VLAIGTYRDVEVTHGHPLAEVLPALRRERTVERILLRGLPERDVRSLVMALEGEAVPEALAGAIARETEGNPFFVQEIVHHLADEGVLDRDVDASARAIRIEEMRLPESVREVIGRRLSRLGKECSGLLTLASVIGRELNQGVLEQVGDLEPERLLAALEEALSARVLEKTPNAIGRFRFAHALIRETLYEELTTIERIGLHRRVAEAMETLYKRDPEPHLTELAHHFLEALPGGDVGDPRDGRRLARAAVDAARHFADKRALVSVLEAIPWAAWGPDDREERLSAAEELIRAPRPSPLSCRPQPGGSHFPRREVRGVGRGARNGDPDR
jgi:predicted ATPase